MELLRRPKTYSVGRHWENSFESSSYCCLLQMTNVQITNSNYLLGKNPLGKKLSWMKRILNNPFWYKSSLLHQSIAKQSILCSLGIIPKQAPHERRMNYDTICRIVNGDFINKVAIFLLFTSCVTFLSTHTFTYVGLSKQKQYWCI